MIIVFQRPNVEAQIGQNDVAVFGFASQGSGGTAAPPVTLGQFTVSGLNVIDRFTYNDVSYPFSALSRRTN